MRTAALQQFIDSKTWHIVKHQKCKSKIRKLTKKQRQKLTKPSGLQLLLLLCVSHV